MIKCRVLNYQFAIINLKHKFLFCLSVFIHLILKSICSCKHIEDCYHATYQVFGIILGSYSVSYFRMNLTHPLFLTTILALMGVQNRYLFLIIVSIHMFIM